MSTKTSVDRTLHLDVMYMNLTIFAKSAIWFNLDDGENRQDSFAIYRSMQVKIVFYIETRHVNMMYVLQYIRVLL